MNLHVTIKLLANPPSNGNEEKTGFQDGES
jgi:hypothetical protein